MSEKENTPAAAPAKGEVPVSRERARQGRRKVLRTILLTGGVLGAGLSGYLPLADRFATERNAANATTPIFMAHGTHDPVVILKRGEDSRDALASLGHKVQWHTYPMPHSVHPREVADIAAFLKQVLPA